MTRLNETLDSFYNLFNKLDKACKSYCNNTLYKELDTSPSLIGYTCFKLTKENDEILIHINYAYSNTYGVSYGNKTLPINEIIAITLES